MGGSRDDLAGMPESVRKDFGGALHAVQEGRDPGAKALKGAAKGAVQLSEDHDGDTFRAVYTVEMQGFVYVLHCFQKKSKSGRATPKPDLDLIAKRLKDARALHRQQQGKTP